MIALALRAAWLLRSRAAAARYLHPVQFRHLNALQRWGVVYRALDMERIQGRLRVDDFERTVQPGDTVYYTVRPQSKGAGLDWSTCVRAAYLNRRGEWEPALFIPQRFKDGTPTRPRSS